MTTPKTQKEINLNLSNVLKERFCRDLSVPIQVFRQDAFMERINLLGYAKDYELFCKVVSEFNNDEEYLAFYNALKDNIINYIKTSETYLVMNDDKELLNRTPAVTGIKKDDGTVINLAQNIGKKNVYNENNIGKTFVSIDLAKANFSTMVNYSLKHDNITVKFNDGSYDWDVFLARFVDKNTDRYKYLIKSKYIRQVVFGNCNVSRQILYERFITTHLRYRIAETTNLDEKCLRVMCDDELIYEVTNEQEINSLKAAANAQATTPIHFNVYKLERVNGTREGYALVDYYTGDRTFKCVNSVEMMYVYALSKGISPTESFRLIYTEYGYAYLVDDINVSFIKDKAD